MSTIKVLVTGGSGLVGSNLREICPSFKYLSSKDCNLLDYIQTLKVFNEEKPDIVIHLGAKVGGIYFNQTRNLQMFEDNMTMNMNVIKVCRVLEIKKFIGCLSTCVFPDNVSYPITEDQLHNGPPHSSNEGYSYSKRMLEFMCRQMNQKEGYKYSCITPTNVYGKYDNFKAGQAHVIPDLIHKCYLAKLNKTPFVIRGTGSALRQFIYAKDLAFILKSLIYTEKKYNNIICTPPLSSEVSIKYIAEQICKAFDYNNIEYDTSFSDGQLRKTVDNKKLMKIIPDMTFVDISDGLNETIEWVKENYENIRK